MLTGARQTLLLLLVLIFRSTAGRRIYNVLDFYAAGDHKTDDTHAFLAAWSASCNDNGRPVLLIPKGRTFLMNNATFQGPCKSPVRVQLNGGIVAPNRIWTSETVSLLTFFSIDHLTVDGAGAVDGRGAIWWSCFNQKRCTTRPVLLSFVRCNSLRVQRIQLTNSANKHMTLLGSTDVRVRGVTITAPGDSPNTDGITMALSSDVEISRCTFQTGDDCVSILSGSSDIRVVDSTCGPGHGTSVGSLGGSGSPPVRVEGITVANCSFFQTMTGIRIKTWQGGQGYAKGFRFEHIKMTQVQNPIIIDQFYCPQGHCPTKDGGVAISDASFVDIRGTSLEEEAIKILCSPSVPCRGIYFNDVSLSLDGHAATPANATVLNAHGTSVGKVVPPVRF